MREALCLFVGIVAGLLIASWFFVEDDERRPPEIAPTPRALADRELLSDELPLLTNAERRRRNDALAKVNGR